MGVATRCAIDYWLEQVRRGEIDPGPCPTHEEIMAFLEKCVREMREEESG